MELSDWRLCNTHQFLPLPGQARLQGPPGPSQGSSLVSWLRPAFRLASATLGPLLLLRRSLYCRVREPPWHSPSSHRHGQQGGQDTWVPVLTPSVSWTPDRSVELFPFQNFGVVVLLTPDSEHRGGHRSFLSHRSPPLPPAIICLISPCPHPPSAPGPLPYSASPPPKCCHTLTPSSFSVPGPKPR